MLSSQFVAAALIVNLEAIRDVAADLERELDRVQSDNGMCVKAMATQIRSDASTALRIIDSVHRRRATDA